MTTPGITSGVTELTKPRGWSHRPNVVFRFESSLAAGSAISTPIFDHVPDGFPYNELEVGTARVVRVASRFFGIYVLVTTTIGARLDLFTVQDNGVQQASRTIYVPSDGTNSYKLVRWQCPSRRAQFRLVNTPLGVVGTTTTNAFVEVVNEG